MVKKYTEKYYARHGDPRTVDWLLMESPLNVFILLVVYLFLVKLLGPILMRRSRPYALQNVAKLEKCLFYKIYLGEIIKITEGREFLTIRKPPMDNAVS
ncbi:hypothetical protein TNIN_290691 [Trichonephila inaurata madagascariensis]|uniref:Uncharacterized protein n=1 Tax=Trichonephila inaurata madagascariensis TaxID=2747483 RepID=A0A8X7BN30_9ARAC|nr:hypothetical protein TNIN_290691 [Trichonephila inaurata madagascariensis]